MWAIYFFIWYRTVVSAHLNMKRRSINVKNLITWILSPSYATIFIMAVWWNIEKRLHITGVKRLLSDILCACSTANMRPNVLNWLQSATSQLFPTTHWSLSNVAAWKALAQATKHMWFPLIWANIPECTETSTSVFTIQIYRTCQKSGDIMGSSAHPH